MNSRIYASTILGMDFDVFVIIIVCLGVLALAGFVFYLASIFVDNNHVKIIERIGKYHKTLHNGWHFIVPILDKVVIDLEIERKIFECKKELTILGTNGAAFKITYSYSYFLIEPKDYYYLTSSDEENVEFISNQIILDYYNRLSLKTIKSIYDTNNNNLIAFINNRISQYGIKIEDFIIRTAVIGS